MSEFKCIKYGTEKVVLHIRENTLLMTFPDILSSDDLDMPSVSGCDSVYFTLSSLFTHLRCVYNDFKDKRAVGLVGCCLRNQMYLVRCLIFEQCRYLSFHHYIKPSDYKRISYYLNSLDDAIMVRVLESEALAEEES